MTNKVAIVSDSTCDLGDELIKKNNITIVPLYVNFSNNDISLRDGVDVDTEGLYKLIDKYGYLPKTAAATPGDILVVFEDLIKKGYDIIFMGISSQMSKTYENALHMGKAVDANRIFVLDSKNLSSGIGLGLLKACKFRDEGYSAREIVEKLTKIIPCIKSQFAIETMEFLHKGGRCSSLAKLFGTVLKIKPIILVRDGAMSVGKKPHGKMKVALDYLLSQIEQDTSVLDPDQIMVTHSLAWASRDYLVARLKEMYPNIPVIDTVAGCVISSHCGIGTIGILYITK